MVRVRNLSVWASVLALAILVGATVFQLMVIVPEFERDMPGFIASKVMPAKFWGSDLTRVLEFLPLVALALNWKSPRRKWLSISAGLFFLAAVATIFFFYPRLAMMGLFPGVKSVTDPVLLAQAVREWVMGDLVRFWGLILPSFLASLKALVTQGIWRSSGQP